MDRKITPATQHTMASRYMALGARSMPLDFRLWNTRPAQTVELWNTQTWMILIAISEEQA